MDFMTVQKNFMTPDPGYQNFRFSNRYPINIKFLCKHQCNLLRTCEEEGLGWLAEQHEKTARNESVDGVEGVCARDNEHVPNCNDDKSQGPKSVSVADWLRGKRHQNKGPECAHGISAERGVFRRVEGNAPG